MIGGILRKYLGFITSVREDSFQEGSRAKGPVIPNTAHGGSLIFSNWYFFQEV